MSEEEQEKVLGLDYPDRKPMEEDASKRQLALIMDLGKYDNTEVLKKLGEQQAEEIIFQLKKTKEKADADKKKQEDKEKPMKTAKAAYAVSTTFFFSWFLATLAYMSAAYLLVGTDPNVVADDIIFRFTGPSNSRFLEIEHTTAAWLYCASFIPMAVSIVYALISMFNIVRIFYAKVNT